jgi:small subunit ribosomal protein S9
MVVQKQEDQAKPETRNQKLETKYIVAHGRRKEAAARVRLFAGKGATIVNGIPIETYFPGEVDKTKWQKPFFLTKTQGQYYASIKVCGSGKIGQLDAVLHGLSRALSIANPDFRPILKKAGLLTRDPRVKERRKYGLAQKARKGKQSPRR